MNRLCCLITGGHSYLDKNAYVSSYKVDGKVVGVLLRNRCTKCGHIFEVFIPYDIIFVPELAELLKEVD